MPSTQVAATIVKNPTRAAVMQRGRRARDRDGGRTRAIVSTHSTG